MIRIVSINQPDSPTKLPIKSNLSNNKGQVQYPVLFCYTHLTTNQIKIIMNSATFVPYQRLELKSMSTEKLLNIIRIAATNYPDTSLILTPRIDQSGQAYYWTGLRYGGCTELDFKLCLNKEIEAFILCFLIKGRDGLVDVGNFTPDNRMTQGIDWLQSHLYRHLEYCQGVRDFIRTSNGRTFQNRKLTVPHGSIVYSQEIKDVFSTQPQ